VFAVTPICQSTLERSRRLKLLNAFTAISCGGLPAVILGLLFPGGPQRYLIGFVVGILWGNAFEYWYHRSLLHGSLNPLSRRHMEHHAASGTAEEAEHVNFGESPVWVVLLFLANGGAAVIADVILGLRIAPGVLTAFSVYFVVLEEIHFRIHLNGPLPLGLRSAKVYHLFHHDRPDSRFNVFLPLFDWVCGTASPQALARSCGSANQTRLR
jgi:sterol desaturase/sphingolipid hydroxylase (fatty acid hydroxylase superfamily)